MSDLVIAIDGPAGAGKSTVAKAIAKRTGLTYLDTGAMYRAIALKSKRRGLGPTDGDAAADLMKETVISFGEGGAVLLDGEDVSDDIRSLEIGELASALSTAPELRRLMVWRQQELVGQGGVILEGRDATTVIAPQAHVKVYLTASLEERAKRRTLELQEKGQPEEFARVRQQIENRDHRDVTRADSPLTVAPDATIVETGGKSVDDVVEEILRLAQAV
jgi:cytidylate kinase